MSSKFVQERNKEIREAKGDIPWWVIGEKLGIHQNTVMQRMRKELNASQTAEFLDAINQIKSEMQE